MKRSLHVSCISCGKMPLEKNEVGINKKLLGESVGKFFCLSCLSDYLDVSEEDILAKIEEFKASGCKLFE